jgi:hypothetical protein
MLSALDARVLRSTDARFERSPERIGELAGCAADVALSTLRRPCVACLVEDDGERPQCWLRTRRGECRAGARAVRASSCAERTRRVSGGRHVARRVAVRERPRGGVRFAVQGAAETEVSMSGQLALVTSEEMLVPAAVWEALSPERQVEVALRLARLLARLMEAARDE